MNISIIGLGSWPLALAKTLCDNNHDVLMWSALADEVDEFNLHHTAKKYLPNVTFSSEIKATNYIDEVLNHSEIIIIGIPTKFYRDVLLKISLKSPKLFVNVSKGIEPDTHYLMSEIIHEIIDKKFIIDVINLSGPSHAEELVLGMETTLVSSCNSIEKAELISEIFTCDYLRVYVSTDLIGTQVVGALKNVIAIASGILAGLGKGDNAKAALITRGLVEIKRYALLKGAQESTIYGLAGLGDLIVTTSSVHSRNYQAGFRIGQGENPSKSIESSVMVVEGIRTCNAVVGELNKLNIEMPITQSLYDVFYNEVSIEEAIINLMRRTNKFEWSE